MLNIEIVIPNFVFVVENEEQVVRAMGNYEWRAVNQRLRAGISASGERLPVPKDGGRALDRSHQLLEGIELAVKKYSRFWGAMVQPNRKRRSEARDRAAAVRRRTNEKTEAARQSVEQELLAAGVAPEEIATRLKRIKVKARRVHKTNMDVAAVLAYAPKDARAKAGDRARYDVFSMTEKEKKDVREIAVTHAQIAIVEKRTGVRHRGRGVAG